MTDAVFGYDVNPQDRLEEITSPTLIIHGVDDQLTPPGNAEQMAAAILGSELDLRPTARHGYFLEDPGATATVIAFLQRHPLSDVIDDDAH